MTFGKALREFLKCTNIKQTQLAEHLGYDVSYISRWLSDAKLPSIHGNDSFFTRIISFILKDSSSCCRNAICNTFEIDPNLTDKDFEDKCIDILTNAYKESDLSTVKSPSYSTFQTTYNCNLSQLDISFESNNSLLAELTSRMTAHSTVPTIECISIPFTSDYGKNECIPFWMKILTALPSGTRLHLRMLADISDSDYHINICRDICSFYGALKGNISVEFYHFDQNLHLYESLLVFKEDLCVITYQDVLLGEKNVLITQDSIQTKHYYGTVNYLLRGQLPVIESSSFHTLYEKKFFPNFFTSPQLFSLHTNMTMLFINMNLLKPVLIRNNIPEQILELYSYYEKTIPRWTVFIYKSAIIDFLFGGSLNLFLKTIILTKQERKNYIIHLIDKLMEGNRLFIVNDTNDVISKYTQDFSLFLGNRSMFLVQHNRQTQMGVHHSTNNLIITCFQHLFAELALLPEHALMSGDDTINFLRQNLELI